jgi:hypothetical protein
MDILKSIVNENPKIIKTYNKKTNTSSLFNYKKTSPELTEEAINFK